MLAEQHHMSAYTRDEGSIQ